MFKKLFLIPILIIALFLAGCNKDEVANNPEADSKPAEENTDKSDDENDEDVEVVEDEIFKSKLSGLKGDKEKVERRPIAVMIDNHRGARWQAGLSEAEIVYEILVEGTITRYMALFVKNDPVAIGPIRSARSYYISKLLEYDAAYSHCGASKEVVHDIKATGVKDIDEKSKAGAYYYRNYDVDKYAPHNLYTNMEGLRKAVEAFGFTGSGEYESFIFNDSDSNIEGNDANEILINYSSNNTTKYLYDSKEKVYKRYKDGELHIDENDKSPITAKNIIIQKARTGKKSNGHKDIKIIGEGKGLYITNGKVIDVTWKKAKRSDKTRYYDSNGDEIKLNPGHTWVQVVTLTTPVKIN